MNPERPNNSPSTDHEPNPWDMNPETTPAFQEPNIPDPTEPLAPSPDNAPRQDTTPERQSDATEEELIIRANYSKIKKRRGETFAKEVRETLPDFLSIPDFHKKITGLIPKSYNSLATLRDNYEYIHNKLIDTYTASGEDTIDHPKNPYELARRVGYELTGPFSSAKQFIPYKNDNRLGERLCTFGNPGERLRTYHILWLRHHNADNIPPADRLTPENLTDEWRQYLREVNRYNAETDQYNLQKIRPSREDPYGTSSMSVQISRTGSRVSIKNRYNHTVESPDATLHNNLDNLTSGLRRAVYAQVGREDLLKTQEPVLANGYTTDNSGGIHPYYCERDDVYYGHYEKIHNGNVVSLPESEYHMIASDLYIKKGKSGKLVDFSENDIRFYDESAFQLDDDGSQSLILLRNGAPLLTYTYDVDKNESLKNLRARVEGRVYDPGLLSDNPFLSKLTVARKANIGSIGRNLALTEIAIERGAKTGDIHRNPALTKLSIGGKTNVGGILHNPLLTELSLAEESTVGAIMENASLANLSIPKGTATKAILENPALETLSVAEGASTTSIYVNQSLAKITLAERATVGDIEYNRSLTELSVAQGAKTGTITNNRSLRGY